MSHNFVFRHVFRIKLLDPAFLCNCVGSPKCCSKFGVRGVLLVFIWAVRTACGARDSRQTKLFTEQLVCLAKLFPSFRASCLRKRCRIYQALDGVFRKTHCPVINLYFFKSLRSFLTPEKLKTVSHLRAVGSSPGLQWDGEGQALQDGLFEERFTALDHQMKAHRLSTCTFPK